MPAKRPAKKAAKKKAAKKSPATKASPKPAARPAAKKTTKGAKPAKAAGKAAKPPAAKSTAKKSGVKTSTTKNASAKKSTAKPSTPPNSKPAAAPPAATDRPAWDVRRLEGKTVACTGGFFISTLALEKVVELEGGTFAKSVTRQTDYLVVGQQSKSKSAAQKKAEELNRKGFSIAILPEQDLRNILPATIEMAVAALRGGEGGHDRWVLMRQIDCTLPAGTRLENLDFRNCEITGDFRTIEFVDCDFRNAQIAYSQFGTVANCRFDSTKIRRVHFAELIGCSFRDATVDGMNDGNHPLTATGCDFDRLSPEKWSDGGIHVELTDCTMRNATVDDLDLHGGSNVDFSGSHFEWFRLRRFASFPNVRFDGARIARLSCGDNVLSNASFRSARLEGEPRNYINDPRSFQSANLSGADFEDAILADVNFHHADLSGANLKNAVLRGSDLSGANLERANLAGADFTDARFGAAAFAGAVMDGATGLEGVGSPFRGGMGPAIQELVQVAVKSRDLKVSICVTGAGGRYRVSVSGKNGQGAPEIEDEDCTYTSFRWRGQSMPFQNAMLIAAQKMTGATLRLDTVKVEAKKCPLKSDALARLAADAWCEAFGDAVRTDDELQKEVADADAERKAQRDAWIVRFKKDKTAVENWNALTDADKLRLGSFAGSDLAGLHLDEIEMEKLDFQEARFAKARLAKARLTECDFRQADFRDTVMSEFSGSRIDFEGGDLSAANLHGAKFWSSNFRNAKLGTADLTDVRFYRCDLRGADLSDALLKGIDFGKSKYDETTILPKLTDAQRRTLKWAGKGPGPAIREPRRKKPREVAVPGSLEFPGMLETLVGLVDSGRLDRGLKMLKAERFQLFAEVLPDSVVGVVKSQTDPDLVYACRIDSAGGFSCCTQNLNVCGGLRGSVCKHLVVLTLGLSQGGELDPATACNWIAATASGDGALDKDRMSEVFLKYKGAEAGEIDWRPTETVPEDFYAF